MITYISHEQAAEKLCVDCVYCQTSMWGHTCTLQKSKVTGGPKWSCEVARESWFICGGRKWKLRDKVVPVATDKVDHLNKEENIESYMACAREWADKGELPAITCGLLEEALRRVKKERGEDYTPRTL